MQQTIEQFTAGWLSSRIDGIRYAEVVSSPVSPEEEHRNDGSRVQRTILCPWIDRFKLIRDFVGYPTIKTIGEDRYLSRLTPDFYPDHKNTSQDPFLFCTQAQRVIPMGLPEPLFDGTFQLRGGEGVATYFLAKITFLYETLTYEIAEDFNVISTIDGVDMPDEARWQRWITFLVNPSVKAINLPLLTGAATAYYVDNTDPPVDDNHAVPGQPIKLEKRSDISVTWHDVPREAIGMRLVNPGADSFPIDDAIGKVNSDFFPPGIETFAPGTLLLLSCTPRPMRSVHGDRTFNLEFRFSYVDFRIKTVGAQPVHIGHQGLLKVDNTATAPRKQVDYHEVTFDGNTHPQQSNLLIREDGKNIHDWADFASMFRVPV